MGLGYLIGAITGYAGKIGLVRNKAIMLVSGAVIGLITLYVAWVVWIFILSGHEALILSPVSLIFVMIEVSKEGVWSIGNDTPTGWFLYAVWATEACMIVGFSATASKSFMGDTPFCKRWARWAEEELEFWPLSLPEHPEIIQEKIERGGIDAIQALTPEEDGISNYSKLILRACEGCEDSRFLTFKIVDHEVNKKGEEKMIENVIAENLVIDAGKHTALKEHWIHHHEDQGLEDELIPAEEVDDKI
ncbi:MAG: hypothetical protein GXP30_08835 [Verrucomicrobia bacterium]|nr:hypothetical protein [Verrucomicrobiota bacterium]